MNNIDSKLIELNTVHQIGLMTHLVVGYPSLEQTVELSKTMTSAGVDFIELQIPFSDPLADGPTIMRACEASLEQGTRVSDAFNVAKKISLEITTPLLFMAYFNTVFKYGTEKFCRDAQAVGISGLIIPDLPLEEDLVEQLTKYCQIYNLKNIRVISPVSTPNRLTKNAKVADGFVYCTARQGTTGAKSELDPSVTKFLKHTRKYIKVPLAVGFGISNKDQIDQLSPYCDVAVVGSALLNIINQSDSDKIHYNVTRFIKSLR